ncbi:MAG: YggS family pyridoxal phosphate-dependent enzyme [Candidatus Bipolaricaulia bacterium]
MRTSIEVRVRQTIAELPPHVRLVAAAKTRTPDEIRAAIAGGVRIVGHNYVQEAKGAIEALGRNAAECHMIGHLQRNKVKDAVRLFDLIQTVDSVRLAEKIDAEAGKIDRVMPVLIEINSAGESDKSGVLPEEASDLVHEIDGLRSIRIDGLMTMGPLTADPEDVRPFFRTTKELFDRLAGLPGFAESMRVLSMGMSDSYPVAIEEGANMVRIGSALFGAR